MGRKIKPLTFAQFLDVARDVREIERLSRELHVLVGNSLPKTHKASRQLGAIYDKTIAAKNELEEVMYSLHAAELLEWEKQSGLKFENIFYGGSDNIVDKKDN